MNTLTITPRGGTKQRHQKSRSFSVLRVSQITVNSVWTSDHATTRPIWLQLLATPDAMRPFVANLRQGRTADIESNHWSRSTDRIEILRSAGYHYHWQRNQAGCVVTISLPDLLALDPGMIDAARCTFVCLTPTWWQTRHGPHAEAVRFAAFVRNRTRRPLLPGAAFSAFLLEQALAQQVAVRPDSNNAKKRGFTALGLADAGLLPPLLVAVDQQTLDGFLANTVRAWVERQYDQGRRVA